MEVVRCPSDSGGRTLGAKDIASLATALKDNASLLTLDLRRSHIARVFFIGDLID